MRVAGPVSLQVYNTKHQMVYSNHLQLNHAGPHRVQIPLHGFDAGLYIVQVKAGEDKVMQKLIVR